MERWNWFVRCNCGGGEKCMKTEEFMILDESHIGNGLAIILNLEWFIYTASVTSFDRIAR